MKQRLKNIFYSFSVQLVLLHFKKFQVLLVFWWILFGAVGGFFMQAFGVNSLYLAPEYLDRVNALSAFFVGASIGIFIMSWNITTFILFCRHFKFLATTSRPFLKYCINNGIIPLIFLFFYFYKAIQFDRYKELITTWNMLVLTSGFLLGLIFIVIISFLYFFRADVTITRKMVAVINKPSDFKLAFKPQVALTSGGSRLIKVTSYLNSFFSTKPVRDVSHYSANFIETIFSRHNFAAMLSIFFAFVFLIIVGFFLDNSYFQLPAAASITLFFAILVAVAGAFSYFLQSWSVPFFVILVILLNVLYRYEVIDPTNKAYGLDYNKSIPRTVYDNESLNQMASPANTAADYENMVAILNQWKARQSSSKPKLVLINVSGGGTRSATFTLSMLQRLDSLCGGQLMDKTFMITGASGGMLGAAYFRELALQKKQTPSINLQHPMYVDDISKDLLNATFSSFVARDLASPAQRFKVGDYSYIKDRGYAFEQKLSENTRGLLNKQLKDIAPLEKKAAVPLMLFNAVITRDGRKLVIGTQPMRFLMKPVHDSTLSVAPDADVVDFASMFTLQNPMNLRLLTALRMNATFPYVLPNVWLPSAPVIDVMDAGLRDNFGQEIALRFVDVFKKWIDENTSGILLIQIRDRKVGAWDSPFESEAISELITKPMLLLQFNWYKMQEYTQDNLVSLSQQLLQQPFYKLTFQYDTNKKESRAALNFHLTQHEKIDIKASLDNEINSSVYPGFSTLIKNADTVTIKN